MTKRLTMDDLLARTDTVPANAVIDVVPHAAPRPEPSAVPAPASPQAQGPLVAGGAQSPVAPQALPQPGEVTRQPVPATVADSPATPGFRGVSGVDAVNGMTLFAPPPPRTVAKTAPTPVESFDDEASDDGDQDRPDGEDDIQDIMDAMSGRARPAVAVVAAAATAGPQVVKPASPPAPMASVVSPQPAQPPQVVTQPAAVRPQATAQPQPAQTAVSPRLMLGDPFVGDPSSQNMARVACVMGRVNDLFAQFSHATGLCVLFDPGCRRADIPIHGIMHLLQWEPHRLAEMDIHSINRIEVTLSAMQVYVQTVENHWNGRHRTLDAELSRILVIQRRQHSRTAGGDVVDSKGEMEALLINSNPDIGRLVAETEVAKEMATRLHDLGARFAQLEDGLKRTITVKIEEYRRNPVNPMAR